MSEVVIYHHLYNKKFGTFYLSPQSIRASGDTKPSNSRVSAVFLSLSKISALIGIALILLFYTPKVLAWGESVVGSTVENFRISTVEVQNLKNSLDIQNPAYNPPFDSTLTITNQIIIPAIGVNTEVQEATLDNYESALKKGIWRVSDFGAPDDNRESIILAAHRFGYLAWTNSYRYKNSFFSLPKLKVGDTVEIDWKQRKYLYEVYATGKGLEIMDYSADLILYTCETLTGPEKLFVYAKRIS